MSRYTAAKPATPKTRKLNREALKIVDEKAKEIADALFDSTIKGHVLSAKLLVDLAEGNIDADEAMTKRPLRSVATELAAEPPWNPNAQPDTSSETPTTQAGAAASQSASNAITHAQQG
jgi:hypothetical protein